MSNNFFKNGKQSFIHKNCKIGESLFDFATQKKNTCTIDSVLRSLETPYNYNNDIQFGNLASKSQKGKSKSYMQSPQKDGQYYSKIFDKSFQQSKISTKENFHKPNRLISSKLEKPIDNQQKILDNHSKKYKFSSFMGSPGRGDPFFCMKIGKSLKIIQIFIILNLTIKRTVKMIVKAYFIFTKTINTQTQGHLETMKGPQQNLMTIFQLKIQVIKANNFIVSGKVHVKFRIISIVIQQAKNLA